MMTISTRGRYATRMVVLLATQEAGASMTKAEIADAEGISAGYVQQLMMALRLGNIVDSHRGREGGFRGLGPALSTAGPGVHHVRPRLSHTFHGAGR